jgi:hypothetical protein
VRGARSLRNEVAARALAVTRLVQLSDGALPTRLFQQLLRGVRAVGTKRLRRTYQTTFWFDFSEPSCIPELIILLLRARLPRGIRLAGVEWWLSRMYTTDVGVDFHRDRDERRALSTGREVRPRFSSVLFLNRVRGGALAVTPQRPNPNNPALAPTRPDFALIAPRPNRFVWFDGRLTHGVLDADNQIPIRRLPGRSRLRRSLVMNWWQARPWDLPAFADVGVYRELRR